MFYILFFNLHSVCVLLGGTQCESNSLFDHGQHKEGISKSRFIQTTFLRLGHGANQVRNTERYKNILIITNLVSISATC